MGENKVYSGLKVDVERDEEQGYYIATVNVDGAPMRIAAARLGGIDAKIAAAAADKSAKSSRSK